MTAEIAAWRWQPLTLRLRTPFRVAYGVSATRTVWWLRLGGDAGWGESAIPPYYGIGDAEQVAWWEAMAARSRPLPDEPDAIAAWVGDEGPAPARAALDLALHDRLARRWNVPLHRLLDLPPPAPALTSFTIGLADPDTMAEEAAAAGAYPILKIKLGRDDDEACLAAVRRARPDARLRLDANAAWSPDEAVRRIQALARFEPELIEQPVAKDDIEGLGFVQAHTALPVVADESLRTVADLERLAAAGVAGINLKLMKVGGLAPALTILRRAKALGLRVLLGCMIETSLGVTAAFHLAALADWIDLDSPLLIVNDPFVGVAYDPAGRMRLPDRAGIGVTLRAEP
ncbi:MAG: dipeptide epimerase [Anaerolineae bacterium]|nr:dipeptide epimerase [Caldilineales bacterium]MCX7852635.1 dipeptide epimerase [Caldilineales bacterium]MDW8268032.1 dipeptide epimerase [Anaerolineae bacterium]